jgi:hypothetical protein
VLATIVVIVALQAGPSLWIVFARGLAANFDWIGYTAFQLGSLVLPLAVGCLGLLFRRNPGLGFFVVSVAMFVFATLGNLTL